MNNKPTIIDGVDVAGCEFCSDFDKTCRELNGEYNTDVCDFDKCENINNCYYKQLQRAKAENKQLQEDLTALQQTYKACEKEYKNLSEKYFKVLELSKKGIDSYEFCIRELEAEYEKLKTTLNEGTKKSP